MFVSWIYKIFLPLLLKVFWNIVTRIGEYLNFLAVWKSRDYVFRFDKTDYENGYSRNLLWRLWEVSKLLQMNHLFDLCCEVKNEGLIITNLMSSSGSGQNHV